MDRPFQWVYAFEMDQDWQRAISTGFEEAEAKAMTNDIRRLDSAKIIEVIEIKFARGIGTNEDPVRIVTQLWTLEGRLLSEDDSERAK